MENITCLWSEACLYHIDNLYNVLNKNLLKLLYGIYIQVHKTCSLKNKCMIKPFCYSSWKNVSKNYVILNINKVHINMIVPVKFVTLLLFSNPLQKSVHMKAIGFIMWNLKLVNLKRLAEKLYDIIVYFIKFVYLQIITWPL